MKKKIAMFPMQALFPGMKFIKTFASEEPPRLKAVVSIDIEDRDTGEKMTRKITIETDQAEKVGELIVNAIDHRRTLTDIESFCKGREGVKAHEENKQQSA